MKKYLVIDQKYPIIFDLNLSHCDIAKGKNVTSAGFIDNKGTCFGLVLELRVLSKKTDTTLIKKFFKY